MRAGYLGAVGRRAAARQTILLAVSAALRSREVYPSRFASVRSRSR